jgi:ribosomal-protein-serine acetyltransferase
VLDDEAFEATLPNAVILRRLSSADAVVFAEHVARDLERLGQHLPWPERTATTQGAERWLRAYERHEDGRVLVVGAWDGLRLIGGAVLFHHDAEHANVEIGCWVLAAGEGRGLAYAACRELLAIARNELEAERVEWRTTPVNERSRRLAERLGFRHDGTLRSNYVMHDARHDTEVFSLIGSEIDRAIAP